MRVDIKAHGILKGRAWMHVFDPLLRDLARAPITSGFGEKFNARAT